MRLSRLALDTWLLLRESLGDLSEEFNTWFLLGETLGELSGELDKSPLTCLSSGPKFSARGCPSGSPEAMSFGCD